MRSRVRSSTAEKVDVGGNATVFIVSNRVLEGLLFNRALTGVAFRRTCLHASRLFVRHIMDEIDSSQVAELLILSKGLAYQLGEAYATETGKNLPTNMVATVRMSVEKESAKINVPYSRFDAGGDTLIIGDTVASGSTIIAALDEYMADHSLSRLYVLSYAGSVIGARNVSLYCRSRGVSVSILYGLAAFGLGDNGFDLSFLHPDTITTDKYASRARSLYAGKPVSSVGWDFGSQMMAPTKYRQLCWVEARAHDLPASVFGEELEPLESPDPLWREKDAFEATSAQIWPES